MPTVAANGLEIGYEVRGDGPPLVMLHSATSSGREDFAAQAPLLSKSFRLYLPDARGHATTRWDAGDGFRYDWLVDDLVAFADAVELTAFHLVGFSMGAMTALQFAIRHQERLRSLVVVGISTEREPRASVLRKMADPARADREDPRWAAELERRHGPVQGAGAWRRLLPAIAADVAVQPLLSFGELRGVEVPALVVVGDRDPFVPVGHAWSLQRHLRDARLLVAPGCGHEVPAKRPTLFNDALLGFYRSIEAPAPGRDRLGPNGDAPQIEVPG